jgi:hypothetical protein
MKYAKIQDGVVQEILTVMAGFSIQQSFHPDIHQKCVQVTNDEVQFGWTYADGVFTAPVIQETTTIEPTE